MKNYGSYDPSIAADFIAQWEGCELAAYQCSAGVWTIGYGHTKGVSPGDVCTEAQAKQWLQEDLQETVQALAHYINVPVSEGEFIALTSLAFNVGVTRLTRSKLLLKLNQGNREGASLEFLDFDLANGKRIDGLTRRRKSEYELFLKE